jgi:hypothetical protein
MPGSLATPGCGCWQEMDKIAQDKDRLSLARLRSVKEACASGDTEMRSAVHEEGGGEEAPASGGQCGVARETGAESTGQQEDASSSQELAAATLRGLSVLR